MSLFGVGCAGARAGAAPPAPGRAAASGPAGAPPGGGGDAGDVTDAPNDSASPSCVPASRRGSRAGPFGDRALRDADVRREGSIRFTFHRVDPLSQVYFVRAPAGPGGGRGRLGLEQQAVRRLRGRRGV